MSEEITDGQGIWASLPADLWAEIAKAGNWTPADALALSASSSALRKAVLEADVLWERLYLNLWHAPPPPLPVGFPTFPPKRLVYARWEKACSFRSEPSLHISHQLPPAVFPRHFSQTDSLRSSVVLFNTTGLPGEPELGPALAVACGTHLHFADAPLCEVTVERNVNGGVTCISAAPASLAGMASHTSSPVCKEIILTGSKLGEIKFWNRNGEQVGKRLIDPGGKICSICVSTSLSNLSENVLATGSDRSHIKIWAPYRSNNALAILRGHGGHVTHLQRNSGRYLWSGGRDGKVNLWDMDAGRSIKSWKTSDAPPHPSVTVLQATDRSVVVASMGRLLLLDPRQASPLSIKYEENPIRDCDILEPHTVAIASGGGASIWDLRRLHGPVVSIGISEGGARNVQLDKRRLLITSFKPSTDPLSVWQLSSGGEEFQFVRTLNPAGQIRKEEEDFGVLENRILKSWHCLAIGARKGLVAALGSDGVVAVWDSRSGRTGSTLDNSFSLVEGFGSDEEGPAPKMKRKFWD